MGGGSLQGHFKERRDRKLLMGEQRSPMLRDALSRAVMPAAVRLAFS